jgi:NAD(P)-dependent dehydrogenase (short-subunit alcohol dehydrogenase family)
MLLITGAGSGLGLELCRVWLRRGARVVGAARGRAEALRRLATHSGGRLTFLSLDVASAESLRALPAALRRVPPVDLLIHHASMRQIISLDRLSADRGPPLGLQLLPALHVTYAALPHLAPGARVICLTTPLRSAGEFGSLGAPPRVSPAALRLSLQALAADLAAKAGLLALFYPGPAREARRGERLEWVIRSIDGLLLGPAQEGEGPRPLVLRRSLS